MILDQERLDWPDAAILAFVIFVIVSIFTSDFVIRPILIVMGLLAAFFGFKSFSGQPQSVQLSTFLKDMKVGAHRGLAADAPENTLEAFAVSKKFGADSIEFDVEFTKDGVPVLMHDDTVDRTTDGRGGINELTWEEVKKLNAAAKFKGGNNSFAAVPHLHDAVKYCLDNGFKIFFDIKNFHPNLIDTILKLFENNKELYTRAAVCSFNPRITYSVKRADPKIITAHTWRPYFITFHDYECTQPRYQNLFQQFAMKYVEKFYIWSLHKWLWKVTGADLILANHNSISQDYLRMWRQRGMDVVAWTVNDYHERLFYMNTLKCVLLTDKLSDVQTELQKSRAGAAAAAPL